MHESNDNQSGADLKSLIAQGRIRTKRAGTELPLAADPPHSLVQKACLVGLYALLTSLQTRARPLAVIVGRLLLLTLEQGNCMLLWLQL